MKTYLILIGLLCFSDLANAQNPLDRKNKDHAVFFAVKDYEDEKIGSLRNPISDAEKIEKSLRKKYGFQTKSIYNPSKEAIQKEIKALQNQEFNDDEQLLLYFSGHGKFIPYHSQTEDGKGYFLPVDCFNSEIDPFCNSCFSYHDLLPDIDNIPCEHILLIIDACHSGTVSYVKSIPDTSDRSKPEDIILDVIGYKSRFVITSGGNKPTPDGKHTSPMTEGILRSLETRGGKNGLLTVIELYADLQDLSPRPWLANFGEHEPGGDFLMTSSRIAGSLGVKKLGKGEDIIKYLWEDNKAWTSADSIATIQAYKDYQRYYPKGKFIELAQKRIQKLLKLANEQEAWKLAEEENTISAYSRFLEKYPNGPSAELAKDRVASMDFAAIKSGAFKMGDRSYSGIGATNYSVKLNDFLLGRNEVSKAEFRQFVLATGYITDAEKERHGFGLAGKNLGEVKNLTWRNLGFDQPDNHPVVGVSWYDAINYCNWKSTKDGLNPCYQITGENRIVWNDKANGYRLPTEAEWEFAARNMGRSEKFPWDNNPTNANQADLSAGNHFTTWSVLRDYDDNYIFTAPIGTFEQGQLGLYDIIGNVEEWCWDWYAKDYYQSGSNNNPRGPKSGTTRVIRGGSWGSNLKENNAIYRSNKLPNHGSILIGFRLAKNVY